MSTYCMPGMTLFDEQNYPWEVDPAIILTCKDGNEALTGRATCPVNSALDSLL